MALRPLLQGCKYWQLILLILRLIFLLKILILLEFLLKFWGLKFYFRNISVMNERIWDEDGEGWGRATFIHFFSILFPFPVAVGVGEPLCAEPLSGHVDPRAHRRLDRLVGATCPRMFFIFSCSSRGRKRKKEWREEERKRVWDRGRESLRKMMRETWERYDVTLPPSFFPFPSDFPRDGRMC